MSALGSRIRAPSQPPIRGDYQYRALRRGPALQRFWHRGKLEVMDRVVPIGEGDRVIDIGCGSGNLSVRASRRTDCVIGIDPSLGAVAFCASRGDAVRCSFVAAMGDRLPLPEGSADVALLVEVLEHVREPADIMGELHRVLAPRATLFVTTPNYGPGSPWPVLEWLADRSGRVASMAEDQHVAAYSPSALRDALASGGFDVERLGTFYRYSPFVALVSSRRASAMLADEVKSGGLGGAIIWAVAKRR